jgi:hypothetical protein
MLTCVLTPSSSAHRFWGTNRQISSPWFWGTNQETAVVVLRQNHWQTIATGFEAKLENSRFSSLTRVQCGSHTVSPDLLIVQPPSARLMTDLLRSSAPSLLLLPQSSLLPAMSHSAPTHYETRKHAFSTPNSSIWVSSTEMHQIQQTKAS